jgi:PAS domain S-box-containing protein
MINDKMSKEEIIEEYKKREKEFRQFRTELDILKSIISNSNIVFFKLNKEGNVIYSAEGKDKVFGYTQQESNNLNLAELFPHYELERAYNAMTDALKGKPETTYEFTGKQKNGRLIPIEVSVAPSVSDGIIDGVYGIVRDISIRKRIEKARDEIETKLKNIIEHSTNIFFSHDRRGVITYISPQIEKFLGYKPEEVLGRWTVLLTDNPINKEAEKATQKAIDSGIPQPSYEAEMWTKSGKKVWAEVFEAPVLANGRTVSMVGSLTDITQRIEYEQKLIESEKFYKTLSDISTDYAYSIIISEQGKLEIEWYFGPINKLTGFSSEELIAMGGTVSIAHQDDLELIASKIEQQLAGKTVSSEYRIINSDGEIKWLRDKGMPVLDDEDDRVLRIVGIIQDITAEKEAQLKLKESEEKLQVTFASIGDAVITTDINGIITKMNRTAEHLTGWKENESLGNDLEKVFNIINAQTGKKAFNPVDRVIETGEICGLANHTILISKNGEKRQIADSAAPIRTKDNKIIGVVLVFRDVTEEYKRREELRKSQIQLERGQKIANFGSWEFDFNNNSVFGSDEAKKIYGISTSDEFSIDTIQKVPLLKYRPILDKALKALMTEKAPYDIEFEIKRQNDGEIRLIHSIAEYDQENNKVFGIIHDITDQRKIEDALKKSEENFRMLAENARDFILVHDLKGQIIYANPMAEKYIGHSNVENKGLNVMDFVPSEEISQLLKRFNQRSEGAQDQFLYEVSVVKSNGEKAPVEISSSPIIKDGKIQSILLVVRDIADRKSYEKALKESEIKYKNLVEDINDLVWEVDTEDRFTFVNSRSEDFLGLEPEEVIGSKCSDYLKESDKQRYKETFLRTYRDHSPYKQSVFTYIRSDGSESIWESSGKPIFNDENVFMGFRGISRDITERKQAEIAIMQAKEKAEQSDALKSAFLANMSHEIRSPMNSIVGFAKLLEDSDISKDERMEYSAIINSKSKQLLNLINDIIDISKIESGIIETNPKHFNLNNLLRVIKSDFSKNASEKNLSFDIYTGLRDDKAVFYCDPLRIKQLLTNLVSNAIKFTDHGGVKLGYKIKDQNIEFFVKDTGIGIEKEKQEIIFKRFMQVDNSFTRQFGGTGLGLALVKEIVDHLKGSIKLESEPGKGSTFYVTLPCKTEENHGIKEISQNEKKAKIDFNGKTFLVAEDEFTNYKLMEKILIRRNAEIIWAKNGREAVELYKQHSDIIDVIIMDLKMPIMNGYEATGLIKQLNKEIPIIALTAYAMSDDEKKALDAGCDRYITKPVSIELLFDIINEYFK